MIVLLAGMACFDVEKIEDPDGEPSAEDTSSDPEPDAPPPPPPPPFAPGEGHWTYAGGNLIPAGTTCPTEDGGGEMTDPVGFVLTNISAGGFTITSDDASVVSCSLLTPESPDPGNFACQNSSQVVLIEDVEDADIEVQIDTSSSGFFGSDSSMITTFELTLTCLSVDHWWGLDCGDIVEYFPSPCTIQFTANATLDVEEDTESDNE